MSTLNDAVALYQQGRLDEADALCRAILADAPRDFDVLHLRGAIAYQRSALTEAITLLETAVTVNAGNAAAFNTLGMAHLGAKDAVRALASFDRAIALKASLVSAHNNRGSALRVLKRYGEALTSYDAAIALKADYAEAWINRALALHDLKRYADAAESCNRAIALSPNLPTAHNTLGLVQKDMARIDEALASYDRAVALDPALAEAWSNRGVTLYELKHYDEALASCDRALALDPTFAPAWSNRGIVLHHLRRFDEALTAYERTLALDATYANGWVNRGTLLVDMGRHGEGLAAFARAAALEPDNAGAWWNLGILHLMMGEFEKGWPLHEWRWKSPDGVMKPRGFAQPVWLGDGPLAGETILLYADQGFGDAVQFIRYAPQIAKAGARVVLEVRKPLVPLLGRVEGIAEVVAFGAPLPPFDLHCALGSLPLAFKMNADNVPSAKGYLSAAPEKLAEWRATLGETSKPRIGIAWTGNPDHHNNHNRSIALAEMLALLSPDFTLVSLQKQLAEGDREILAAHPEIRNFADRLADFSDTAALISQMDVVVTVDTSVAHVAGALGKTVWILLPSNPDWRWMLERGDTPWYASAKLYRQERAGEWGPLLARVKADLARL